MNAAPRAVNPVKSRWEFWTVFLAAFVLLAILHLPFLRLPYFWDEAGYYVPAALDFYRHGLLIPRLTLPNGHTPLLMIYLSGIWLLAGFRVLTTRLAMILIAAATVATTYRLGSQAAGREAGVLAALLLALSPTFFAQSSLVYPSLPAALFTTLAVFLALDRRWTWTTLALSLAVLSYEISVIAVPVIWAFLYFRVRERRAQIWALSAAPVILLGLWAMYYHHATGFWTGNSGYLQYNLYSALHPLHILRGFIARVAKVFVLGFDWIVVAGAGAGIWFTRKRSRSAAPGPDPGSASCKNDFVDFRFLALGLIAIYIVFLSVIGGAVLSRYLMPVFPVFYILCVMLIGRLPRRAARLVCFLAAVGFVGAWYVNPPYPFPYDDNLSYATFVRLHERAAQYLQSQPGDPVISSAWPAVAELIEPYLGYVSHPLKVAPMNDFRPAAFANLPRFDLLYLYSREWDPANDWPRAVPALRPIARLLGYQPPVRPSALVARFHLTLLKEFRDRGQWVRIYAAPPLAENKAGRSIRSLPTLKRREAVHPSGSLTTSLMVMRRTPRQE